MKIQRASLQLSIVGEVFAELKKVAWPSRQEAVRLTILVMAISIAVGIILGAIDMAFNYLLTRGILGG